ncbi:MAG: hypothetical protein LBT27_04330, partial [Prevotellaceae bacterium]|nr:hypothetical protein [Prevotellaceae bacterium]
FIGIDGGTYSNDKGFFYIPQNIEQIELSSVGYYSKKIALDKNIGTIFLSPQVYEISEAKVMPAKKKRKSVELGYAKEKSKHVAGVIDAGKEIAVYIPLDNENNIFRLIKQVIIKGKTYNMILYKTYSNGVKKYKLNSDKTDSKNVFKINFYKVTESNNIGEIINTEDIIFSCDLLDGRTVFDVSKYSIYMPENGIFIAIEWVGKTNTEIKDTKKSILSYICVSYKINNSIVYEKRKFRKSENNWQKVDKDYDMVKSAKKLDKDLKEAEYYTPLISIVLE